MTIRPATPTDRRSLIRLWKAFNADTQTVLPPEQAQFRAVIDLDAGAATGADRYLSDAYRTFVAEDKGIVAGYISGHVKTKPNRVYSKEGYVEDFFVEPGHRGHHLGQQLFDALTGYFIEQECAHLALTTHLTNTGAQKFYERQGMFQRTVSYIKPLRPV